MKTNLSTKTIVLTKAEMKAATTYGTVEYNMLQVIRRDYPGFEIVEAVKVKKPTKTPLDRLNISTIKAYVKANGSPEQKQEFLTISTATIDEDGIYHAAQRFFDIKKWFLAEFPKYKESVEAHNAEIARIFSAIDDKIAETARQNAQDAYAKAFDEAKSFLEIA